MYRYHAFGCRIQSDLKLPELMESKFLLPDIVITEAQIPIKLLNNNSREYCRGNLHHLVLDIPTIGCFLIDEGKKISFTLYPNAKPEEIRLCLLGSCMGALLQQKGLIVLHGNAISTDGENCFVYVGDKGAGKSTTAAYYHLQGAGILADDVCAIYFNHEGVPHVLPSYPQLKLWQDSVDLLGIEGRSLRQISKQIPKLFLSIQSQFINAAKPLKHVIEISRDEPQAIIGHAKIKVLIKHSYRSFFLNIMGRNHHYLRLLMQLAASVKVSKENRILVN